MQRLPCAQVKLIHIQVTVAPRIPSLQRLSEEHYHSTLMILKFLILLMI